MGSPASYISGLGEDMSFWLNQAKAEYKWNSTSNLTWSATATFIQIAVSPLGDLYGIQSYNDSKSVVQYAYKFNFRTGLWFIIDSSFNVSDIKFDKLGNMFLLDGKGRISSNGNKNIIIRPDASDFEITVG